MRAPFAAALIFAASAAGAQSPSCWPRERVVEVLTEQYREAVQARGITVNGLLMEMWASPDGTWTMTVTRPDGVTCLMANGYAFDALPVIEGTAL